MLRDVGQDTPDLPANLLPSSYLPLKTTQHKPSGVPVGDSPGSSGMAGEDNRQGWSLKSLKKRAPKGP